MTPNFPAMAFNDVMFWIMAIIICSALVKLGSILMNKLWYRNGDRERRSKEPDWLKALIDMHGAFLESNQRVSMQVTESNVAVAAEIREFSRSLNMFAESLRLRSERAFDEHAAILSEVRAVEKIVSRQGGIHG